MKDYYHAVGSAHISDQVLNQYVGDGLDILEEGIIEAIRELFNFLKKNNIQFKDIPLSSLQMRHVYEHSYMAHRIDVGLSVQTQTVNVPVPDASPILEVIEKKYAEEWQKQLTQQIIGAVSGIPVVVDPNLPYGQIMLSGEAMVSPGSDKLTAAEVGAVIDKLASPPDTPPSPKTYMQLKQEALEKGKLAIPPIEDGPDVV